MRWICVLLLFLVYSSSLWAQSAIHSLPATLFTGSGAYSHNFLDAFSFLNNQAALGNIKQVNAGVFAERKYLLRELSFLSGTVCLPVGSGGIGLGVKYFGNSTYNESQVSLAYGKNLGKACIGIQFNYHMLNMAEYGNDAAYSVEVGALLQLAENVQAGIQVSNPLGGKFRKNKEEKIATIYKSAVGWEVSQVLLLTGELIKEENQPANLLVNIQYRFIDNFFARLGIATASGAPFASAGVKWKNIRTDIMASYHPQLGLTPGILFCFSGKNGKL